MPDLNALIQALQEVTPEKARATGYGLADMLLLGQGPKLAALSTAVVPELDNPNFDYQGALDRMYASQRATKAAAPSSYIAGEIAGGVLSPLNKLGAGSSLGRIINNMAQASAIQSGQQGATVDDIQGTAIASGLLSGGLESIPLVGKALRGVQEQFQQAGLGLRGAAMKKAGSKVKDKTILGEGYALIKDMLRKGEGNQKAIEQAQKVLTGSANRAGSYVEIADDKIKELVKKQEDIVIDVTNKLFKTTKVGKQKIMLPRSNVPAIEFNPDLSKSYAKATSTGNLTSAVGQDIGTFKQDYLELVKDITNPIQQAKAAGTKPAVNLEDLLVLRRKLSGKYNQYAQQGKAEVYTAVVDDLNRAITNNLKNYEKAGVLKAGIADEFRQAGKDMQKLITFNDAVTYSALGRQGMAKASDLSSALTGGAGVSMAAYLAGVKNPILATAIGTSLASAPVQGSIGRAIEKGMDVAEPIASAINPALQSSIKTQTPTVRTPEELAANTPAQPVSEAEIQDFRGFLGTLPTFAGESAINAPAGPEGEIEDFKSFLNTLPTFSANTETPSPANGDLPSQQPGLKQGVSLSADRFGSLADFYPALAMTESSMNPLAQNPNSSAKGLFQFVDKTAQGVGLQDPFDPRQSLAAVQSLTQENIDRFGIQDPVELYKMHYLGAPTYEAYANNLPLTKEWQIKAVNSLPTVTARFQNNLAAVQQPDSGIRQQFLDLFG